MAAGALLAALVAARAVGSPTSPEVMSVALAVASTTSASVKSDAPVPQGAIAGVDACVARIDPQLDIGYDRIAARCPDLMKQLETGAWAPWLPRGWKDAGNDLSAGSLTELRELVARESRTGAINPAAMPNVHSLQPILTALAGSRNETGWSRFKTWLRSVLERPAQPSDESWFNRMVAHAGISQSIIRLTTYAALGAVVVLAGVIVFSELRTAGLLGRRAQSRRKPSSQSASSAAGIGWSDIERAPLADRPRMLLELIVRRLSDRGALAPSAALTVRELTRAVQLTEADDRARLADLALAAEQVRYSATPPGAASLDEPLGRGKELLSRLDAAVIPDASATR